MQRVGLISDTHVPAYAGRVPEKVWEVWGKVDMVFHLGDFVEAHVYDYFAARVETYGVAGNMDEFMDDENCPEKRIVTVDGTRIALMHGWGPPRDIVRRILSRFAGEQLDVLIYGHTHQPEVSRQDGLLVVNPGSAVSPSQGKPTVGLLKIGEEIDAEILEL